VIAAHGIDGNPDHAVFISRFAGRSPRFGENSVFGLSHNRLFFNQVGFQDFPSRDRSFC
jgi:hypothetical protein